MNNRGADYIKRLLKDKERFKKWNSRDDRVFGVILKESIAE